MFLHVRQSDDLIELTADAAIDAAPGYYVVEYDGDDAEPMRYWDREAGKLEPIEQTDEERAATISAEADRRVDEIASPRMRERLTRRGLEINEKIVSGQHLTAKEEEDRDTIKAIWARVAAVRDAEDAAILTYSEPVWP